MHYTMKAPADKEMPRGDGLSGTIATPTCGARKELILQDVQASEKRIQAMQISNSGRLHGCV